MRMKDIFIALALLGVGYYVGMKMTGGNGWNMGGGGMAG